MTNPTNPFPGPYVTPIATFPNVSASASQVPTYQTIVTAGTSAASPNAPLPPTPSIPAAITVAIVKHLLIGLAFTVILTLGAALVSLGPTTDWRTWLHGLEYAEFATIGAYILKALGDYVPGFPIKS